ncbi:MAG: FIST C-terminal domain-containing protein [Myxococcaceae bacterium]|nr:FIST C-terminal domain-containing protein [Myxococcaceae bacterium]
MARSPGLKWASAIARKGTARAAVEEAAREIHTQLGELRADLVVLFASAEVAADEDGLPALVQAHFPGALVVGTSGLGVIGASHEEEDLPAIALSAASLPGVQLASFQVDTAQFPSPNAPIERWHTTLGVPPDGDPNFLLFTDPYTCDTRSLIAGLDRAYPRSVKTGGLASGGRGPGRTRLYLHGITWRSGAVGVALKGRVRMDTIVAQGCRPIGTPMLVTRCDGQVLLELNQRRPIEVLREVHEALPDEDKELFRQALFLGVEMKSDQVEYGHGDFLVRNIVGVDARTGALAIGAELRPFQVVQFMLRDAATAAEDLNRTLARYREQHPGVVPSGALLFSCTGRGRRLFGHENHDTGLFEQVFGPVPLAGFFCNGEIGPVGGTTFQHGYTSAFALFRPK